MTTQAYISLATIITNREYNYQIHYMNALPGILQKKKLLDPKIIVLYINWNVL